MAQTDFSNANIEIIGSHKPLRYRFLALTNYNSATDIVYFMTIGSPYTALGTPTITVLTNTPTKYSLLFTGTFTNSLPTGVTEFGIYIRYRSGSSGIYDYFWKVTNVTVTAGDTYSFVVDVEVSGS